MTNLIRKTITVPENIYTQTKIVASSEDMSFSAYVSDVLEKSIKGYQVDLDTKNPSETLGTLSLGATKPYKKRSDIYDEHINRKMGN
jgi:hypothetical protein